MGPLRSRPTPRWRGISLRLAILVVTVLLGLTGFLSGVGVTERPDVVDASVVAKLYYTLGLFIFGGMDLGLPHGGPWWGRVALWTAYFSAPVVTASAVIEAVARLVGYDRLRKRHLNGHIVVVGAGRMALLYLRRLRTAAPDQAVVVIAEQSEEAALAQIRDDYNVQVVEGDIGSDALLRSLRMEHAARVLLLTEDDFTNLDAAARILAMAPELHDHIIVHVADLRFMRSMATTRLARRCHVFNSHQIAASHLVHAHLLDHFHRTKYTDVVVLAGFGRFGQTVLDELQQAAAGAFDRVVIVDLEASPRAAVFAEQVGFEAGYRREVVDGDLRDPARWKEVQKHIQPGEEPVFVVGSGIDRTNLRIALDLARRYPDAFVIARSDRQWSFAEDIAREAGVHPFSVASLVAESMPDAWFGPRGEAAALDPLSMTTIRSTVLKPESASE